MPEILVSEAHANILSPPPPVCESWIAFPFIEWHEICAAKHEGKQINTKASVNLNKIIHQKTAIKAKKTYHNKHDSKWDKDEECEGCWDGLWGALLWDTEHVLN